MLYLPDAIGLGVDALGVEHAPIIWDLAHADWKHEGDLKEFLDAVTGAGQQGGDQ